MIIMSCALTQGYALDCRNNKGGIIQFYLTEMANVTQTNLSSGFLMENPTSPVTTITMAATTYWRRYQLVKETGEAEEKETDSVANGTVYHDVSVKFPIRKLSPSLRNELYLLAQNRLHIIGFDRNGQGWWLGYNNGMEKKSSDNKTGKAMGDFNGYMLEFEGKEEYPMIPVSLTIAQMDALIQ